MIQIEVIDEWPETSKHLTLRVSNAQHLARRVCMDGYEPSDIEQDAFERIIAKIERMFAGRADYVCKPLPLQIPVVA